MSAELAPGSGVGLLLHGDLVASTIDGQGTQGLAYVQLAGHVGPDLYTTLPNIGVGIFETTPVTQTITKPTELSGSVDADGLPGQRRRRERHLHGAGRTHRGNGRHQRDQHRSDDARLLCDLGSATTDVTRSATGAGTP